MTIPPFTVARYGVWVALAVSALSVWLGTRAGVPLDHAVLRAVFFFLIVTVMAFGAEAVLLTSPPARHPPAQSPPTPDETAESAE
jgi:hypothetical protein